MSSVEMEVISPSFVTPPPADEDEGELDQEDDFEERVFQEWTDSDLSKSEDDDTLTLAKPGRANGLVAADADAADEHESVEAASPPASTSNGPVAEISNDKAAHPKSDKVDKQRERKKAKDRENRKGKAKGPIKPADLENVDWAAASASSSRLDWSADVDTDTRPSSSSPRPSSSRGPATKTPRPASTASVRSGSSQPAHPSITPRVGKFWNHDDRRVPEEDSGSWTAVSNKRKQAKAKGEPATGAERPFKGRQKVEEEPWRHDRYEELEKRGWKAKANGQYVFASLCAASV
jgi:hypothetical protein